jgi:hypothetical protein
MERLMLLAHIMLNFQRLRSAAAPPPPPPAPPDPRFLFDMEEKAPRTTSG